MFFKGQIGTRVFLKGNWVLLFSRGTRVYFSKGNYGLVFKGNLASSSLKGK